MAAFFDRLGRLAGRWLGAACVLCGARDAVDGLCPGCHADLPRLPRERCPVCALASPGAAVCGACLADPPAYDATHAALEYRFPVDALVQRLKYAGDLSLAPVLGRLLADSLPDDARADRIVPVPLHPKRLSGRGFNQALELARPLAKRLGMRAETSLVSRTRDAPAQAGLPWKERAKNVRGAFACDADLKGLHVAVVDDVMTTGASLHELAKLLKRCGAARVSAWVVARTPRPG